MRIRIIYILVGVLLFGLNSEMYAKSTRQERKLVKEGNKLYGERKFVEAANIYEEALKVNPSSASASYNLGLSQIRQVVNVQDTTPKNRELLDRARENLTKAGEQAISNPGVAEKAWYNLGNLEFNRKEYGKAIEYYKQSLRIDPNDENARRNLRIAQKQQQKQNQNQNQNQQNQDKQNQDKQNQDKQNQDKQNQDKQQQPKEQNINQQTAERILQAMDNKESQTRARVNKASKAEGSGGGSSNKRW